jgi:hypothetical protein
VSGALKKFGKQIQTLSIWLLAIFNLAGDAGAAAACGWALLFFFFI